MRDFRDAKAMAHSLRDALKAKAVETTHSECLELIAKAFGNENWNILSAKIEAAESRERGGRAFSSSGICDAAQKTTVSCSFCGKTQHEVETIIAGPPPIFVCNECVRLCNVIIDDQEILNLMKTDEEIGNQSYPAAVEYARGKSTEQLTLCVEQRKKLAELQRVALQQVKRRLAMRDGEALAEGDVLASPVYAHLRSKTKEDLLVLQQQVERELTRYEDLQRIAATVLGERRQ